MTDNPPDLDVAEERTATLMATDLHQHVALVDQAFDVFGFLGDHLNDVGVGDATAKLVTTQLLSRCSNDLRVAVLLAMRGYPLQAMTVIGSLVEAAWTVGYIGCNDALAQEWAQHDDPRNLFRPIKTMLTEVLRQQDLVGDQQVEAHYRVYRQLCWAKHVNPLFQQGHGIQTDGEGYHVFNGPDTSDQAKLSAWFALEQAVRFFGMAIKAFAVAHLSGEVSDEIVARASILMHGVNAVAIQRAARWRVKDPFPGRG